MNRKFFVPVTTPLFVLLTLNSASAAHIALMLDCSGSMSGTRIKHAKEAAKLAVELIEPGDELIVVGFNESATVSPWFVLSDELTREPVRRWIDRLQSDGGTNYLAPFRKGALPKGTQVVFLSDGEHGGPQDELLEFIQNQLVGQVNVNTIAVECPAGSQADVSLQKMAALTSGSFTRIEKSEDLVRRLVDVLVRFSSYRGHVPVETEVELQGAYGRLLAFAYDGRADVEIRGTAQPVAIHRAVLPGEDVLVSALVVPQQSHVTIRLANPETRQSRLGEIFRNDLPEAKLSVDAESGAVIAGDKISPVAEFSLRDGSSVETRGNRDIAAVFELLDGNRKVVARADGQEIAGRSGLGATLTVPKQAGPISLRSTTTINDGGVPWTESDELQLQVVAASQIEISPKTIAGSYPAGPFNVELAIAGEAGVTIDVVTAQVTEQAAGLTLLGSKWNGKRLILKFDAADSGNYRGLISVAARGSKPMLPVDVPIEVKVMPIPKGLAIPKERTISLGTELAASGEHTVTLKFPSEDMEPAPYQLSLRDLSGNGAIIPLTATHQTVNASRDKPGQVELCFAIGDVTAGMYRGSVVVSSAALPGHEWESKLSLAVAEPVTVAPIQFGKLEIGATGATTCQVRNRGTAPLTGLKFSDLKLVPEGGEIPLTEQQVVATFGHNELAIPGNGIRNEPLKLAVSPLYAGRGPHHGTIALSRSDVEVMRIPVSVNIVDVGEGASDFSVAPERLELTAKPSDVVRFQLRVRATARMTTEAEVTASAGVFRTEDGNSAGVPCEFKFPNGGALRPQQWIDLQGFLIAPKEPGIIKTDVTIALDSGRTMRLPLVLTVQ